ncbi:hypothetical protein BKA04_001205 [Cryobacterium mesophilum]|uniref:hypothetical protein n=1 Tax=Terrimesophilobacter mesophilus TaxID=433647 RepID=UPI000CE51FB9|nr:hypothetical protein [Terrimesophilobacter mesophilus]MBB5632982.1 hypothetical protein [Terrimesophilobacter mesophilus]
MTDSGGVSKQFDPRFSPAFQPGYDPRVHREEPPRGPLREESAIPSTGIAPGVPDFAVPEPEVEPVTGPASVAPAVAEGETHARAWWQRLNPWIIVLWALGVVFIAAGIGFLFLVAEWQRTSGFGGVDGYLVSLLAQLTFFGSPMLVVLGLATLTSTVVILAFRWRR